MKKSSRQKWTPPVTKAVLLLKAAVKGTREKSNKILYRKTLGIYLEEHLIPVETWEERVFVLLQYGSGGCSSALGHMKRLKPIQAEKEAKTMW